VIISEIKRNSEFYNTLSEMGLLSTEDYRIRSTWNVIKERKIKHCKVLYNDIDRIGYLNPHFMTDIGDKGLFEVWVDDEYVNPEDITWIEGWVHLYGILPKQYFETQDVKLIFIDNIAKRYSAVDPDAETAGTTHTHIERINLRAHPYCDMSHPEHSAYYIADGVLKIPEVKRIDADTLEFSCTYKRSIDLIFSGSLLGIFEIKAGVGTYIDSMYSKYCYHRMIINNGADDINVNTMFYPCITADKDCIVRVFTDDSSYVPMPEVSRLVTYPEFDYIEDPYNTDNEYLNNLKPIDEEIRAADDDVTILDKFSRIAAYCYRAWEKFPFFCNEQSDFLMCDNHIFGKPTFIKTNIYRIDGNAVYGIVSLVPFESHRDILFYNGMIYSDYEVMRLFDKHTEYIEDKIGILRYVILDPEIDIDGLTLIKFNAEQDTQITNLGEYIDEENLARLHIKMNRFYRNLLILRGKVYDYNEDQFVRVSTAPPNEHDTNMWYELLVNVVPEVFNQDTIEVIESFGLDPYNLPEDLKEGMYSLGLKPDEGPERYTDLLFTYYKLSKHHQKYLVIQSGDGVDDPAVKVYHQIDYGKLPDNPQMNDSAIENPEMDTTEVIDEYEVHSGPMSADPAVGDIIADTGEDNPDMDDVINELLDGIDRVDVEEEYSLSNISYMDEETGITITGAEIAALTVKQKKELITSYIDDPDSMYRRQVVDLWNNYLDQMNEQSLNMAVYKVLLTAYIYNKNTEMRQGSTDPTKRSKPIKYIMSDDEPFDVDIGDYWLAVPENASNVLISRAEKHNLTYIYSEFEPDPMNVGDLWIDIPALTLPDYIQEIISHPLTEAYYYMPKGFFDGKNATVVFDYGAHGTASDVELFKPRTDNKLHKIHMGESFDAEAPEENDVWFEFLDDIDDKICYSDTESIIIRVNERLIHVQFDHDNVTAFLFDDVVMNFRGKLGIRYISIVADLLNSGAIKQENVNVFYKRLVTGPDRFDLRLERLYTGRSHVISTALIDTTDFSVMFSSNIGRLHIDYESPDTDVRERESAYRMVIDYSLREVAFIQNRMMLFVNGHYVSRDKYQEITAGKILLLDFKEIIRCVDIFYSKKDEWLSKAKKACIAYWNEPDTSESIQRPNRNYARMIPIHITEYTMRGYYDVLLEEYIFNGRLKAMLDYLEQNKHEAEEWVKDFKRKFHDIADTDLVGINERDAKVVIPGLIHHGNAPYAIDANYEDE